MADDQGDAGRGGTPLWLCRVFAVALAACPLYLVLAPAAGIEIEWLKKPGPEPVAVLLGAGVMCWVALRVWRNPDRSAFRTRADIGCFGAGTLLLVLVASYLTFDLLRHLVR